MQKSKMAVWGVGENMGTEESKKIWEENAQFWDNLTSRKMEVSYG